MRLGDGLTATTWYQRALEADGADVPLLVRLAQAQIRSGARDAARASLSQALEKDPANSTARALYLKLK
jgi:predicted TPR repeat methyltransferase